MKIKSLIEMNDLSIAQMCVYAANHRLLFSPSKYLSVQMAWEHLVFISKTKNELDLYNAVSEVELNKMKS